MSVDAKTVEAAKALVSRVLRGEVTAQNSPAIFEDDILYFQVGILEQNDAAWLVEQLEDPAFEKDARLSVGLQMTGPRRKEILPRLGGPPI